MAVPIGNRGELNEFVDTAVALTAGQRGKAFVLHPNGRGGGQPPNSPSWGDVQTDQGAVTVDGAGAPIWGVAQHDYDIGDQVSVLRRGETEVVVTAMEVLATSPAGSYLRMNADGSFGQAHRTGTVNSGGYGVLRVQQEFTSTQLSAAGSAGLRVLAALVDNPEWIPSGGGG